MLTFEKVLKVFQAYLDDDPLYEVVQTSHGYGRGCSQRRHSDSGPPPNRTPSWAQRTPTPCLS